MRMLRRVLTILFGLSLILASLAGGVVWWGSETWRKPGISADARQLVIPKGAGVRDIAEQLAGEGVIESEWAFAVGVRLVSGGPLRAGEYLIPAHASLSDIVALLRSGRTVVRRFTVAEGLTVAQVVEQLLAEPALTGEIAAIPPEGSLLPETYHYGFGDGRMALLGRMQAAMTEALSELWARRVPDLPLASPAEALILASIVERETGVAGERARVAGVFVNRLRRGMRLQSDPTVAYGLTNGAGPLPRPLTRADWRHQSRFNTYVIDGLPPTPIANPGREAIAAVLSPESHRFLYFVADGSGGHAFAESLAEHNRNVARWRQLNGSGGD